MSDKLFVLFAPSALYLRKVKFSEDGQIKTGRVINGGWDFELRDGECLCKAGKDIVSRWKAPSTLRHIEVPQHFGDDYNAAILWAENAIKKPNAETVAAMQEARAMHRAGDPIPLAKPRSKTFLSGNGG